MKINKKGFVLAEAIIVAVFIVGIFTYMAMNILPLVSMYETASFYDNSNEMYSISVLYDELLGLDSRSYTLGRVYYFPVNSDDNTISCQYGTTTFSNCTEPTFTSPYFIDLIGNRLEISKIMIFKYTTSTSVPKVGERSLQTYFNYEKQKRTFAVNSTYIIAEFRNGKFSYINVNFS